jgi:hypothetical protein
MIVISTLMPGPVVMVNMSRDLLHADAGNFRRDRGGKTQQKKNNDEKGFHSLILEV